MIPNTESCKIEQLLSLETSLHRFQNKGSTRGSTREFIIKNQAHGIVLDLFFLKFYYHFVHFE